MDGRDWSYFKSLGFMNGSNVAGSSGLGVLAFGYPTYRSLDRAPSKEVLGITSEFSPS